ncbi:MAG TPA: 3-hydroxy-3-methylglutaryl-CoA lyase, partial [Saccharofermentans sp.]|nr:3-hydroxy-3-methylglutaryl-CoA lyase [Saccharofermentans sp.]
MNEIRLLDCTLRDGGYVNDWEFGHSTITSIFERVVDSGAEIIEIGFLDDRRPFDINRTIMPDTKSVQDIFGHCVKRPPMVVGMIDYGTCKLENIQPCEESYL